MNAAVETTRKAALEVLRHNASGPFDGLPRTADEDTANEATEKLVAAGGQR